MNKVENENGLEEIGESGIDELKKQVLAQRARIFELFTVNHDVSNDIHMLLLQVNKDHRIENIDDVCEFMEKIDERFGLVRNEDTDSSRLYSELHNEFYKDTILRWAELKSRHNNCEVKVEFPNSDEDIFSNPDASVEEVISAAEARLELYKDLISRFEKSNETHERLLTRLRELQKFYDELAAKHDMSHVRHPRIEDYEVEIER